VILLWVLILGTGVRLALIHPLQNYLLDFRAYYAAATAATHGLDPYDTDSVRAHVTLPGRQQIIGYLYPPPTLWLLVGFAKLPYPAAQVPWLVLQLGLGVGALGLILRALRCEFGSPASVLVGFAFLSSAAVWELFRWGQFDMIVLFLLTLAIASMLRDRTDTAGTLRLRSGQAGSGRYIPCGTGFQPVAAGMWLGLATVAKVTPIVYLAVLAVRGKWKAAAVGVGVVAILLTAALIWPGYEATLTWLDGLQSFSADQHAAMSPNNMSLRGFVYRLFVAHPTHEGTSVPLLDLGLGTAQWIVWTVAVILCLTTAVWMWFHHRALTTAECVCAAIPLTLLLSPMTWTHHCVQLLLPLALVIVTACRCRRIRAVDVVWITLIVLLFVLGSGGRIESASKPWLNHLISPTTTYAVGLTWLFFVARYVPLKQTAAGMQRVRETPGLGAVRPAASH